MQKNILFIILFVISYSGHCQLELYNEGGDGLTFYVGQTNVVQAEGDVTNGAGATIQFEAAGTPNLKLKGNFLNSTSGVYTYGTESIEFNGSALQTADFGGDNIYGMKTNNSANIQMDRDADIVGLLDFTTGDVNSTTSAYITLGTSATVSGADDDAHNNGPIAKNFTSTSEFTYPVGDGTAYRYSTFTPTTTAAVTMRSTYYGTKYSDFSTNAPIYKISRTEYWDMYRTSGSTKGVVTLSWDTESGGVSTTTDMLVAYYDGADWNSAGGNNHTGTTAAGDVESDVEWSIYNKFFTLATSSSDNALPVELISFTAKKEDESVRLDWQTATEINSDYFSVLRSKDGIEFEEINQVSAAGTSTESINYFNYDNQPYLGYNYYKLVNIDLDGSAEESNVKVIEFSNEEEIDFNLKTFPNPATSYSNFNFYAPEDGLYKIKIFSITGKLTYSASIMGPKGTNDFTLNIDTYESGKYIVQISSPSGKVINTSIEKI